MSSSGVPSTRQGHDRADPEESHENEQRPGTPLLRRKAERLRVVQPGQDKTLGRPPCGISIHKGAYKKDRERLFTKHTVTRQEAMVLS